MSDPPLGGQPVFEPAAPIDPARPGPPRRLLRGSEQLTVLIGYRLLVGISYLDDEGQVMSRQQFCGQVLEVGEGVVVVDRPGEEEPAVLPADAAAYQEAPSGQYRLSQTGEIVIDPDFMTTWKVQAPAQDDEDEGRA